VEETDREDHLLDTQSGGHRFCPTREKPGNEGSGGRIFPNRGSRHSGQPSIGTVEPESRKVS